MTKLRDPLASSDVIAQRRYAYGKAAAEDGDWAAAAEVFEQTLELAPDWAAAWFALAEARERRGDLEGAAAAFRATLAADPSDTQGAGPRLALIGGAEAATALPPAYVARLFDDYASRFDAHLTGELKYRGPALIVEALDAVAPARDRSPGASGGAVHSPSTDGRPSGRPIARRETGVLPDALWDRVSRDQRSRLQGGRRFAAALDIGCGTGLMGEAVRARVDRLVGVDLSPAMIAKARERGVYDALEAAEATAYLARSAPGAFDLILAGDAFCYFGDLKPILAACGRALAAGGLLAFSIETFDGEGFQLRRTMRFAHDLGSLERTATEGGLQPLITHAASTRREGGADVPGLIAVLRKTDN